ncbi:alcohol dehydrogenase, class IV [Metallosphaera yellowstonensis MK1]|uniref:Alcohol dehydrogenase, class IV n=1 Tax=Metallosphaera yellowstonensis MK1 TaxID=671065 RepID=H2C272_9CREN|nr:iron-containing alcohol dehydrogenase [Metallosphaera yellowstonensis]EHP70343.1 alcohol dehydrogenase, class IV [Metallosphaera yellowstonensis MK1]
MWTLRSQEVTVVYGRGSISTLSQFKGRRVKVVTTKSLMETSLLKDMLKLTGGEQVMGPSQHTPEDQLVQLREALRDAEVVVSLGGGSIIDAVKISHEGYHVSVPTTLSGAEHTTVAGFTREGTKRSIIRRAPDMVILDPDALRYTPRDLLVTTGVRALDHAVEALYSVRASPYTDALAREGFSILYECLWNLEDLLQCQIGTWLSSQAFMYAGRGLSHIFGYIFGPRFNIPHGVTSCISLAEAIRFNMTFSREKLRSLGGDSLPSRIESLLERWNVRKRLRDYVSLEEALRLGEDLAVANNSSENPTKMDVLEAVEFIKRVY